MALKLDLDAGDMLVVPRDSGAQIRVVEKSGRRTRVSVESAKPVQVIRARDSAPDADIQLRRPNGQGAAQPLMAAPKR